MGLRAAGQSRVGAHYGVVVSRALPEAPPGRGAFFLWTGELPVTLSSQYPWTRCGPNSTASRCRCAVLMVMPSRTACAIPVTSSPRRRACSGRRGYLSMRGAHALACLPERGRARLVAPGATSSLPAGTTVPG